MTINARYIGRYGIVCLSSLGGGGYITIHGIAINTDVDIVEGDTCVCKYHMYIICYI